MTDALVRTAVEGGIGTITLNRPGRRNAIDWDTLLAFEAAVREMAEDKDAKVLVVRGEGRIFSSGIDLNALATIAAGDGRPAGVSLREKIARIQGIFTALTLVEKPVIAALHGMCLGLGLELALNADFRVAERDTVLGLPEIVLGIIPDCTGTTRLSRLVGTANAKRLILTGDNIDAARGQTMGLIDELAEPGQLDEAVARLTEPLLRRSPLALGLGKRIIDAAWGCSPERQLEMEAYAQSNIVGSGEFAEYLQRGMAELFSRKG